jgi:hypothetical protein
LEKRLGQKKSFLIPISQHNLLSQIRKNGIILQEDWLENEIKIVAQVSGKALALAEPYLIK